MLLLAGGARRAVQQLSQQRAVCQSREVTAAVICSSVRVRAGQKGTKTLIHIALAFITQREISGLLE